jgi:sterol desaturase/sphingolipid hydroxylase (fatty acid hydroxylase superfamily)
VSEALLIELAKLQVEDFGWLQLSSAATFFSLCIVEGLLSRPRLPPKPTPDLVADTFYWLLIPSVRILSRFVAAALLVLLALPLGLEAGPALFHGFGPLAQQSKIAIAIEALVLMDLSAYWGHRLFHTVPALWKFHAIHHSAEYIRWSTTGRVHPVNEVANYIVTVVPCFLIGLPLAIVLPAVPIMVIYAVSAHSQWNPSFGPLKTIFASPRFHRWHHTRSHEGGNKNFANLFSFWDRVFGTYYLPADRIAQKFGLDNERIPEKYLAQLMYPFRKRGSAAQEPSAAESASAVNAASQAPEASP